MVDLDAYRRDIAPLVERLGTTELRRLTGYSYGYCLGIAGGERVLHPMHWGAVADGFRSRMGTAASNEASYPA